MSSRANEAEPGNPVELQKGSATGSSTSLGMTGSSLLHQLQHRRSHSDHSGSNRRLGNGREFTRMQGGQFFSLLFVLRDLRWFDCSEMKINRRNGVVR